MEKDNKILWIIGIVIIGIILYNNNPGLFAVYSTQTNYKLTTYKTALTCDSFIQKTLMLDSSKLLLPISWKYSKSENRVIYSLLDSYDKKGKSTGCSIAYALEKYVKVSSTCDSFIQKTFNSQVVFPNDWKYSKTESRCIQSTTDLYSKTGKSAGCQITYFSGLCTFNSTSNTAYKSDSNLLMFWSLYKKGFCIYKNKITWDYCINSNSLKEIEATKDGCSIPDYDTICEYGCKDGACLMKDGTSMTPSLLDPKCSTNINYDCSEFKSLFQNNINAAGISIDFNNVYCVNLDKYPNPDLSKCGIYAFYKGNKGKICVENFNKCMNNFKNIFNFIDSINLGNSELDNYVKNAPILMYYNPTQQGYGCYQNGNTIMETILGCGEHELGEFIFERFRANSNFGCSRGIGGYYDCTRQPKTVDMDCKPYGDTFSHSFILPLFNQWNYDKCKSSDYIKSCEGMFYYSYDKNIMDKNYLNCFLTKLYNFAKDYEGYDDSSLSYQYKIMGQLSASCLNKDSEYAKLINTYCGV